jgi:hypothetical protein
MPEGFILGKNFTKPELQIRVFLIQFFCAYSRWLYIDAYLNMFVNVC